MIPVTGFHLVSDLSPYVGLLQSFKQYRLYMLHEPLTFEPPPSSIRSYIPSKNVSQVYKRRELCLKCLFSLTPYDLKWYQVFYSPSGI